MYPFYSSDLKDSEEREVDFVCCFGDFSCKKKKKKLY